MSLYGAAPDPLYIRTGGREGNPMGCGGTCPICRPYAGAGKAAGRATAQGTGPRKTPPERAGEDPRYSWLPP